ncbi:MAG: hypothetical protein ABEJ24_01560 [Candidatus Magasanikbacteria bacterium]
MHKSRIYNFFVHSFALIGVGVVIFAFFAYGGSTWVWNNNFMCVQDWANAPEEIKKEVKKQKKKDESALTDSQTELLKTLGIDTSKIEKSAKLKQCAVKKVGEKELGEILTGDRKPSFEELAKLKSCF